MSDNVTEVAIRAIVAAYEPIVARERALTDAFAALVDEMAEYAEHRHHDAIAAVNARYRAARQ